MTRCRLPGGKCAYEPACADLGTCQAASPRALSISARVKVTDQQSTFLGRFGNVEKIRRDPLPYGVRLDGETPGRDVVWFHRSELEVQP